MATLQKFMLFATQCGVGPSPTQSPRTSPLVHIGGRPQKTTLRMLLTRGHRRGSDERQFLAEAVPCAEKKGRSTPATGGHSLKDLFGSHPVDGHGEVEEEASEGKLRSELLPLAIGIRGGGRDSPRRGFGGLRTRALLRKTWRPMLEAIPE
ncbi:hypothetical protein SAY87_025113 [Trapa incisa]|uniref:Uncharacterized protein n=1 Tax=Trapa incisa TaxID=236973 RepID=A0AAN7GFD2_9MYRT|nr:hypothetical protein SAY87_025113 [Trapa incisa]